MTKSELLDLQGGFVARLECLAAFLSVATDSILAVNHKLTDSEKSGFCLCMAMLRRNERGVIDLDRMIQEMEAANG